MEFAFEEDIAGPLERVLRMIRDRLPDLVPYLPSVDAITVLERVEEGPGRVRIVNLWEGNSKMVPAAARPFVTKKMMTWRDHATWIDAERRIEWWFEPNKFKRLFTCEGHNTFEAIGLGDATRLVIRGSLTVYPEHVPAVPKGLARRLKPRIERWIVGRIGPNLRQVPRALQAFFDAEDA